MKLNGEVIAYVVPQGKASADGSMEDGPDYLVFANEASDWEKRIGFPLCAANVEKNGYDPEYSYGVNIILTNHDDMFPI